MASKGGRFARLKTLLRARVAAAVKQGVEDAVADQVDVGADGTCAAGDGRRS